jgi:uncharacterized protein YybS (DUF2232 family)
VSHFDKILILSAKLLMIVLSLLIIFFIGFTEHGQKADLIVRVVSFVIALGLFEQGFHDIFKVFENRKKTDENS